MNMFRPTFILAAVLLILEQAIAGPGKELCIMAIKLKRGFHMESTLNKSHFRIETIKYE